VSLQRPKSPKLVIFGINLPKRGIPPYAIFIKFGLGEGVSGPHLRAKFYRSSFKNVGLQPQQSRKIAIFGINLTVRENLGESTEKGEYRCTSTNLPLCNDTRTVLKVTLLYSVSVITNFVIPKRDKKRQTDRQTRNQYTSQSLPEGNAIPAGPLSDSDEILCR